MSKSKILAIALLLCTTSAAQAEWSWSDIFKDDTPIEGLTSFAPKEPKFSECIRSSDSTHTRYTFRKEGHKGHKCWYLTKWDGEESKTRHRPKPRKKEQADPTPTETYVSKEVHLTRGLGTTSTPRPKVLIKDVQGGKDLLTEMFGESKHNEW